ncbi:hypothetical protein, partial [Lysobacter capsici]
AETAASERDTATPPQREDEAASDAADEAAPAASSDDSDDEGSGEGDAGQAEREGHISAEQALENTRRLLEAKQEQARTPQPWQQLDGSHGGHVPQPGPQSDSAAQKAGELHAAESRMDAIQGSNSTQDRHNQGKRDNRG